MEPWRARLQQRGCQAVRRTAVLARRRHKVERRLAQRGPARNGIDLLLAKLGHMWDALPRRQQAFIFLLQSIQAMHFAW